MLNALDNQENISTSGSLQIYGRHPQSASGFLFFWQFDIFGLLVSR